MTLIEFSKIAQTKLSDRIINFVLSTAIILVATFIILKFSEIQIKKNNYLIQGFIYVICFSLISLGLYGLMIILKPLNVSYFENKMSKDENLKLIEEIYNSLNGKKIEIENNVVRFTFKKGFWNYNQRINLLAEDNLIAVYVKNIDSNPKGGFLDFGSKARLQKKVLNMLEEASQ
jgi:hypothetical protein